MAMDSPWLPAGAMIGRDLANERWDACVIENTPLPFKDLLRRYRKAAGLTQNTLAERASLSARTISDLKRGEGDTRGPAP